MALPKYEGLVAFSANRTVILWDTSTHSQIPLTLQHPEDKCSTAFSPGDQILAISGGSKITIQSPSVIKVSATFVTLYCL